MKTPKTTISFILLLLLLFSVEAQKPPSFYSFKGFHVGLTAQAECITKCSFFALSDIDPVPKGKWTAGWEVGMEFSYHFAKYFGISAGINYGTALSYSCAFYVRTIPGFHENEANYYETLGFMQDHEMMFPIKFEFHYPLPKNLFFTAEVGIKIKGFFHWLEYKQYGTEEFLYSSGIGYIINPTPTKPKVIDYFDYWGKRNVSKIRCELLLGMGLYYKLPYGDLLRFTAGVNLSFKNIVEGTYIYYLSNSVGTFAVKNDFIYTQFSYIHTLNYQKAKKYLKKQEKMVVLN